MEPESLTIPAPGMVEIVGTGKGLKAGMEYTVSAKLAANLTRKGFAKLINN